MNITSYSRNPKDPTSILHPCSPPLEITTLLNFVIITPLLLILTLTSSYISLNNVYLLKTYVNGLTHTACVLLWLLFSISFETHPCWCTQWGLFLLTALQYGSVWVCHSSLFKCWTAVGLFLWLLLFFLIMNNTAISIPVYNSWDTHARLS